MDQVVSSWLPSLGAAALAVLAVVAFAETGILVGFLVPGDTLVFTAGTLIAAGALHLPFVATFVVVTAAAVAGDQVAFLLGRRYGARVLSSRRTRWLSPRRMAATEAFFDRHGSSAVTLARFVPLIRTVMPLAAGLGSMSYRRFTAFGVVGALGWALLTLGAGAVLGSVPFVDRHVALVVSAMALVSLLPACVAVLRARSARRAA